MHLNLIGCQCTDALMTAEDICIPQVNADNDEMHRLLDYLGISKVSEDHLIKQNKVSVKD